MLEIQRKKKTIFLSSRLQTVQRNWSTITYIQNTMICALAVVELPGTLGAQRCQQWKWIFKNNGEWRNILSRLCTEHASVEECGGLRNKYVLFWVA